MNCALRNVFALLLIAAAPLQAQSLQQQNDAILTELKAIRQLLEKLAGPIDGAGQPAAPPALAAAPAGDTVKLANVAGYVMGKADAPITLMEFTDLQCPFCRRFSTTTFDQLKKEYIDTGKVRYISRDFPLTSIHPLAMSAAIASRCAGEQGKFWEMRHTILVNNAALTNDSFATFAQDLKLNPATFKTCASDANRYKAAIDKDMADAGAAGITGTPSFVIGRTSPTTIDGVRIVGAQPYGVFDARLKELLSAKP